MSKLQQGFRFFISRTIGLLLIALSTPAAFGQSNDSQMREFEQFMYGDLKNISRFAFVYAHIKNTDGTKASDIGLTSGDMTSYLRLRFRNNFANVKFEADDKFFSKSETDRSKMGYLWCGIWTVGTNYPVAYHAQCIMGTGAKLRLVEDEVLGYANKENAIAEIKKALDDMLARFATTFFRVRGEI
jgi:hypothetical protein